MSVKRVAKRTSDQTETTAAAAQPSVEELHAKRMRFTGKIITIIAGGKHETPFSVHEPVIKADSDFFKLALDEKWREGQELLVELPEDNVANVAVYIEYLYSGKVTLVSYEMLAAMYVLGEKIQSAGFCNAIILEMLSRAKRTEAVPSVQAANSIYEGTMPKSPARVFMVDSWRKLKGAAALLEDREEQPNPDFLKDLATSMLRQNEKDEKLTSRKLIRDPAWFV